MRIVHVMTRALRAGSEENTFATCDWQVNTGHEVIAIHGHEFDPFWHSHAPPGVQVTACPEMFYPVAPLQDMRAMQALARMLHRLKPDVVHTHQSKAGILGRLAARVVPDAVVVHSIHIVPFEGVSPLRRSVYLAAERWACRHTDLFIGVSDAVGRAYITAGAALPQQVHTVRSGMDLSAFRYAQPPSDWQLLTGQIGCGDRPPVVLMLASFERRKGHAAFLKALAAADLPEFRLLLAGTGPEEESVRRLCFALGLGNCVHFCGHRPDPGALLALADLSVLTSEREGLPRVAVQSMAAGCPMVISHLAGVEEVICDGVNGSVTAACDVGAAVAEIGALLRDPARLRQLRDGAQRTDVSDWSLETLGARTTALYTVASANGLGQDSLAA